MESTDIYRLKHAANTEVIRRLLIKYFMDKGFTESFDRLIYPAKIADLPLAIPELTTKVEVVPHAVDINPATSQGVIGWNMFVLGNQRMYLGETHHSNLTDLARDLTSGNIVQNESYPATRQTTPRRIVNFITRVLTNSKTGYVNLDIAQNMILPNAPMNFGNMTNNSVKRISI